MTEASNSLPDGWEVKALGEVARIELGKTPSRSNSIYWDTEKQTGNVWLSISDLPKQNMAVVSDSKEYLSDEGASISKIVPRKTLMVSFKLTLGRLAYAGKDLYTNEAIASLYLFNPSQFAENYLYYYLTFYDWDKAAEGEEKIKGKTLNKKILKELEILVPPLPEQERIVGVLDEAFEGIAIATAQAEKNLQNARELFQSVLQSTFSQKGGTQSTDQEKQIKLSLKEGHKKTDSTTRGRAASERLIQGDLSLSVGMPNSPTKTGWHWIKLTDIAKLESGHTPSRRHPEYWGGEIPWVGIKDAKLNHGGIIYETNQYTNGLGINNSSARILPKLTVCLSRTASVGYVFIMGVEMATSQDFVNWICSDGIIPAFLKYLLIAEGKGLSKYSSGAVHQTIYYPEVKAFHVCIPDLKKQQSIVEKLGSLSEETKRLEAIYQRKLDALAELKQSLLQRAFTGQL